MAAQFQRRKSVISDPVGFMISRVLFGGFHQFSLTSALSLAKTDGSQRLKQEIPKYELLLRIIENQSRTLSQNS